MTSSRTCVRARSTEFITPSPSLLPNIARGTAANAALTHPLRWQVCGVAGGDPVESDTDPLAPEPTSYVRLGVGATSTFLVVMLCSLVVLATVPFLFGYRSVVVVSGSMQPSIHVGDVVVTTGSDGEDLGLGTVIDHRVGDSMRLHRIVAVTEDGYRTAGDANRSADSELVTADQIEGVGILLVPFVGLPRQWIDEGRWLPLFALAVGFVLACLASRRAWMQPTRRLGAS